LLRRINQQRFSISIANPAIKLESTHHNGYAWSDGAALAILNDHLFIRYS